MNKITLAISTIAIILSAISISNLNNGDVAYVDINRLIHEYKRTEVVQKDFEAKSKILKGGADSLLLEWQSELTIYEKERVSMTKKELELKQELLQNKQQQINNYQKAIEKQLEDEDQNITQTVINDINDFVNEYGKKRNYKIIYGATGSGSIMYAEDSADLTDEVLLELNREFSGK